MRFIFVLGSITCWTIGGATHVAIDRWREWGAAFAVDDVLTNKSLTEPRRSRRLLNGIQAARLLFARESDCTQSSLDSLSADPTIQAMCRHVSDYDQLYTKLGNERLAEYVEHLYDSGPISSAELAYFTPLANLDAVCGFALDELPSDMYQVVVRSKVVDGMGNTLPAHNSISSLDDVINFSLSELYLHTAHPKYLIGLFDQVNAKLSLKAGECDSLAKTLGRLAGLSIAHAIPMGETLTQKILDIAGGQSGSDFKQGLKDIVPEISSSRLEELLTGEEPIEVSYQDFMDSLESDISQTGIFFSEYLRGDDRLGNRQLRIESILRATTGLRYLPVGGLEVMAPTITLKIIRLESGTPSFHAVTRTITLPAYPTAEQLFITLDKYFHL